jgi:hypothetical protein
MSSAQERNIRFYEASYLNAVKRGLEDKSTQVQESKYDNDNDNDRDNRDNSSSSDDEIQTRSKTTRKTERRNERNARKQHTTTTTKQTKQTVAVTQQESASSPIVEKKQKKLTKRQQVLQRYADEETAGIASVLASIADAAVTRSQARNRNTVMWTESDRAAASRAAAITLEVATLAAEATQGKKKKEQLTPYWTRLHEKSRSTVRFQKEMERVKCDFECDFY